MIDLNNLDTHIIWNSQPCPDIYKQQLFDDIKELLQNGLDSPSKLYFHTVILTNNYSGPSITVLGDSNDDEHFYCFYEEKTIWENIHAN